MLNVAKVQSKLCVAYGLNLPWYGSRGARRNFFRGGKRHIQYLLDKIKPHSCNQDFAKGFEPKVNMTLFKKILQFGRHVEQTDAIQVYDGRGSWGKAPSRWAIFAISGKK